MAPNIPRKQRAISLTEWRQVVARLSQADVARLTGLSLGAVMRLELAPHQATLGALSAYVDACDGYAEVLLHHVSQRLPCMLEFPGGP